MEGLPTYKITIDEEYNDGTEPLGIDMIAFTSNPAVLVKGVAFTSQKKASFSDDLKYRITAPAMIPMEIYRRDEDMGEYYVQFTEEEIDTIHKEFMSDLKNRDIFNLEHNAEQKVPAYLLEAWIVDNPKEDKSYSTFGIDVPKGTLMVTAQITDQEYYKSLVKDGRVGFSIEGFLGLKLSNQIKSNMQLPDGEHLIEGKIYVVKDGEIVEVKEQEVEMAAEEPTTEETEVVEEEMSNEVEMEEVAMAEETVSTELAVDPAADSDAILAIVAPLIEEKIAEVLQVIADLKNEMSDSAEEGAPVEDVEMKMSRTEMFSHVTKFLSK